MGSIHGSNPRTYRHGKWFVAMAVLKSSGTLPAFGLGPVAQGCQGYQSQKLVVGRPEVKPNARDQFWGPSYPTKTTLETRSNHMYSINVASL